MDEIGHFVVKARIDKGDGYDWHEFGPFSDLSQAENLVEELAGRENVWDVMIVDTHAPS